jgi:hypothetical protein
MPTAIVDGNGTGKLAVVDPDARLKVNSVTRSRLHQGVDEGKGWALPASILTPTAGDIVFAVKNTAEVKFHLSRIIVATEGAAWFRMFRGVNGDEFAGTVVVPVNLNFSSVNPASVFARSGDVSGVQAGELITEIYAPSGTAIITTEDVPALGINDVFYIELDAGTPTRVSVSVMTYALPSS